MNPLRTWRERARHRARCRVYRGPACGHSSCRQAWIDTGDSECVLADNVTLLGKVILWLAGVVVFSLLIIEACAPHVIARLGGAL